MVRYSVQVSTGADRQFLNLNKSLVSCMDRPGSFWKACLEKGVHDDVIVKDGIQIWRNSCFHKCIIFWGLVAHLTHLPLLGDVKTIKMIVLWSAILATVVHAQFTVTECRTCAGDKWLVDATMAAAIMVVHIVRVFLTVVVVCCFRVLDSSGSDSTTHRNTCCWRHANGMACWTYPPRRGAYCWGL